MQTLEYFQKLTVTIVAYSTEVWGHTSFIKTAEVVFTAYEAPSYASLKISTQCFRMAEHANNSTRALSTHYSFFLLCFCWLLSLRGQ